MPSRSPQSFPRCATRALAFAALVVLARRRRRWRSSPRGSAGSAVATFAGGCFWCMEQPFDKQDGVIATTSGYIGGTKANPTYEEVSSGGTGHTEAVQVLYDPKKVSYEKLLDIFWHNIDPTVEGPPVLRRRQPVPHRDLRAHATSSAAPPKHRRPRSRRRSRSRKPIVTPIVAATEFWPAEEYHQDYYRKNPVRYTYYRTGCGPRRPPEAAMGQRRAALKRQATSRWK